MTADYELAEHFLENQYGERYLYSINREIFAKSRSETVFKERYAKRIFAEDTLYIIIGSDSGLLAKYISQIGVPKGSRYWFVEPYALLQRIKNNALQLENKIQYCIPEELLVKIEEQSGLGAVFYAYLDKIVLLSSLGASEDYAGVYHGLRLSLKSQISAFIDYVRVNINIRPHIYNTLINAADAHTCAFFLKGLFRGKTAVVLAGGPSLDEYIDWVAENRNNLVVIAISRIAKRLEQAKIAPDIYCTGDPTSLSFDISKEMLKQQMDVLLVFSTNAFPRLIGQWTGMSAYVGQRFYWNTELNVENCPVEGPTVSNSAIGLANWMGCSQIVLLGMDSCYSPSGESYAKGSSERKIGLSLDADFNKIVTNSGGYAFTKSCFTRQMVELRAQALAIREDGTKIITPASNAAKVEGVDYVPIENININNIKQSARCFINQQYSAVSDRQGYYKALLQEYSSAENSLLNIISMAKSAICCLQEDQAYKMHDGKMRLRQMSALKRRIDDEKMVKPLKAYGWHRFMRISEIIERSEKDDEHANEGYVAYMSTLIEVAEDMKSVLKEGQNKVEIYCEELKERPSVDLLIEGWCRYELPARAVHWIEQRDYIKYAISDEQQEAFRRIQESFIKELECEDTEHKRMICEQSDISNAIQKMVDAFENKDIDLLRFLLKVLGNRPEKSSINYSQFASGLIHELEQNYETAREHYKCALHNAESQLKIRILEREAFVSVRLHDVAGAITALESLSKLSKRYLPLYADALFEAGNLNAAIIEYGHYLKEFPHDIPSLEKLMSLCLAVGQKEEAQELAERIRHIDPDNIHVKDAI